MVGRKPKPTALARLHGSTEPRNPREPRPSGDLTACPAHFNEEQSAIWREALAGSPPGLLRRVDASVVETWAIAVDIQRHALAELAEQDGLGSPAAKRLLTTLSRAGQTVVRCCGELGFFAEKQKRAVQSAARGYGEEV